VFFAFTIWLVLAKTEDPTSDDDPDMDVKKVYKVMWSIVRLKSELLFVPRQTRAYFPIRSDIQSFLILHLVSKIGFQISEVTPLKLIEKGLPKEDLAFINLLNVPFELVGGWLAARWSRGNKPLKTWQRAFWARFLMGGIATALVWAFPSNGKVSYTYFSGFVAVTLLASFARLVDSQVKYSTSTYLFAVRCNS
jgi:PAT family acetyl-CoA transporter-like MFS transporter 1